MAAACTTPFQPPAIPWHRPQPVAHELDLGPGLDPWAFGQALGRLCAEPDVQAVLAFRSRAGRGARGFRSGSGGDRAHGPAHAGGETRVLAALPAAPGAVGRGDRSGDRRPGRCRAAERFPLARAWLEKGLLRLYRQQTLRKQGWELITIVTWSTMLVFKTGPTSPGLSARRRIGDTAFLRGPDQQGQSHPAHAPVCDNRESASASACSVPSRESR